MRERERETYSDADWYPGPPRMIIQTIIDTRFFIHTCFHAQTLEAYSQKFQCTVWLALPCKQWSCRICAAKKIDQLAGKVTRAKPNRLLTLTCDPQLWDSPRDAFDGTRRHVAEIARKLRTRFGEFEYLRVTEVTQAGWPHYHLLVRSPYIPHAVVKDLWEQATGAVIVDLRQVKDEFNSFLYLVKYLSKMHDLEWTERHVSYSKNFFVDPPPRKDDPHELTDFTIIETHPGDLLYHQFRQAELVEIAYGVFTLNPPDDVIDRVTAPENAPIARTPPPQWRENQTSTSSSTASKPPSSPSSQGSLFSKGT